MKNPPHGLGCAGDFSLVKKQDFLLNDTAYFIKTQESNNIRCH